MQVGDKKKEVMTMSPWRKNQMTEYLNENKKYWALNKQKKFGIDLIENTQIYKVFKT